MRPISGRVCALAFQSTSEIVNVFKPLHETKGRRNYRENERISAKRVGYFFKAAERLGVSYSLPQAQPLYSHSDEQQGDPARACGR